MRTYRRRYIFNGWGTPSVDIHITFRTQTILGESRSQAIVSVEIETPSEYPSNVINAVAIAVMNIHNGWNIPNIPSVTRDIGITLRNANIRSRTQLQTPFDLTWHNLTYENIIEKRHAISLKANGVRMLFGISPLGQFFATSSLNIIPLNISPTNRTLLIDGELMDNTYWAFDLIYANGVNYGYRPYNERHATLTEIIRTIGNIQTQISLPLIPTMTDNPHPRERVTQRGQITIQVKPIIIPTTADEFFKAIQDTLNTTVDNDGIILTPINQPYSGSVLKWKPQDLMTVDFFVGRIDGKITLATFESGDMRYHPEIDAIFPGDSLQFVGSISEFKREGENQWRWIRYRIDKATPNGERVYNAIIRLHADPITLNVITGNSLQLMRKYHNRVKRQIYEYMSRQGVKSITDIGSGKGGDIAKWMENNLFVNAIEPDLANVADFFQRVRSMGGIVYDNDGMYQIVIGSSLINLYPIKAEDYVADETTDALTLFNSATFLGPETLQNLVIDSTGPGGYVVVMVMDGRKLQDLFLEDGYYDSSLIHMERVPCPSDRDVHNISVGTFGNLGCIFIQLKDSSTVREGQIEGLVDISELISSMQMIGWNVETDIYLNNERLMGQEEARYSSAQRLLIFRSHPIEGQVIRRIYQPLSPGNTDIIESPWGQVVRVGVPSISSVGGPNISYVASILQATDEGYRNLDTIAKTIRATQYLRSRVVTLDGQSSSLFRYNNNQEDVPLYLIPQDTWNMYRREGDDVLIYHALTNTPREPGIVIMQNRGQWEPLAKRDINGNLVYIW